MHTDAQSMEEEWFEQSVPRTFLCPVAGCGRQYQSKGKVTEHLTKRHSPKGTPRYRCAQERCTRSFCRMDALKAHQRSEKHAGLTVVYEKGTDESLRETAMRESEEKCEPVEGGNHYKCKLCADFFPDQEDCLAHIASRHIARKDRPFACPDPACSRIYVTRDSLNRHKRLTGHMGLPESPPKSVTMLEPKEQTRDQDCSFSQESISELTQFISSLD
jgi:hypothetical protein